VLRPITLYYTLAITLFVSRVFANDSNGDNNGGNDNDDVNKCVYDGNISVSASGSWDDGGDGTGSDGNSYKIDLLVQVGFIDKLLKCYSFFGEVANSIVQIV